MFQKYSQNLNQKLRLASRNILGERGGGAPVDSAFDRAKAQWQSLEQSVRLLLTEVNKFKVEMKGLGDNGGHMMSTICSMFEGDQAALAAAAAPGGAPTEAADMGQDLNENHPYKDVATLMMQTQAKIKDEDIAVSSHRLPPQGTLPSHRADDALCV